MKRRVVLLLLVAACQRPEPKTPVPLDTAARITSDTTALFPPPLEFGPPEPQPGETDSAKVVNLVKTQVGADTVVFGPVRVRGDSAWVTVWFSQSAGHAYTLLRLDGRWFIHRRNSPAPGRRPANVPTDTARGRRHVLEQQATTPASRERVTGTPAFASSMGRAFYTPRTPRAALTPDMPSIPPYPDALAQLGEVSPTTRGGPTYVTRRFELALELHFNEQGP